MQSNISIIVTWW